MLRQHKWIVGILGFMLLTSTLGQMLPGGGKVLNTTTESPIEGATVTLECKNQSIGIGHGPSGIVRTVVVTSDKDGTYKFSLLDVLGCSFAYVSAEKSGYLQASSLHLRYGRTDYKHIPSAYYLTPEADAVMLHLIFITPTRSGNIFQDGKYSAAGDYRQWYTGFFEAKRIAHTDRETNFVRSSYCQILSDLYGLLTDQDKKYVLSFAVSYNFQNTYASGKFDHDEVVTYCATR